MRFSIIYSVDVPEGENVNDFAPPNVGDLWDQTEDDSCYEFGYLEGDWENGSHRKWATILDREHFDEFVERCELTADYTETMGSIGAPGFGFGWAPAISFSGDCSRAIRSAYVTPIPDVDRRQSSEHDWDRDWERVRDAVLAVYG